MKFVSSKLENNVEKGENAGSLLERLNSLPNDRILDPTKVKGPADDKTNVSQRLKLVSRRVEKTQTSWEKEKMLVTSIFSFSQKSFP